MAAGCIRITISSGTVGSDLTNFPIYLNLSSSAGTSSQDLTTIFNALGSNKYKFGIFLSDFVTQCYVEIVSWDETSEVAEIHFRAPSILTASNNNFYLVYDSSMADNTTYVGITGSVPAQTVWSNSYAVVYHMNDGTGGLIEDSTQYGNDATKTGVSLSTEVTGKIGKAQRFDGVDQALLAAHAASLNLTSGMIEAWTKPQNATTDGYVAAKGNPGAGYYYNTRFVGSSNVIEWAAASAVQSSNVFTDFGVWVMLGMSFASTSLAFYRNGVAAGTGTLSTAPSNNTDGLYIATRMGGSTPAHFFDGDLDEIRISSVTRTSSWQNATYLSCNDTLCTYSPFKWKHIITSDILVATLLADPSFTTSAGRTQVFLKSITNAANAGDVTVATVTTESCLIKSIVVKAVSASQADLSNIAIYGGDGKIVTFISSVDGDVANLDEVDEQVSWTGAVELGATKTIIATLTGVGATAVDLLVTIEYMACEDGGYLA